MNQNKIKIIAVLLLLCISAAWLAKYEIQDGNVKVNGEVDQRRGRKVYVGDVITFDGQEIKVIK